MPADHSMVMDGPAFTRCAKGMPGGIGGGGRALSILFVLGLHVMLAGALMLQRAYEPAPVEPPLEVTLLEQPDPSPLPEPEPVPVPPQMESPPPVPVMPVIPIAIQAPPRPNAITVAAASAPSPAPVAAVPAMPSQLPSAVSGEPSQDYMARLLSHLSRAKRYPLAARKQRQQGIVYVRFTMDRSGHVLSAKVERQCGHPLLNEEAMALLARAAPLPPLPDDMPDRFELIVPIDFSLKTA